MTKPLQRMIEREPDLGERPHPCVRGRSKEGDIEAQNKILLEAHDRITRPLPQRRVWRGGYCPSKQGSK
jgi:hypothetical protein